MKTLRRAIAVGMVAAFATVAFAVQAPADHTEARLTLVIEPEIGPVGQTINATVPEEHNDVCASDNPINQAIAAALQAIITDNPGSALAAAAAILLGALEDPNFQGTLDTILFPLVFADVETQEPLSDPSFWDPNTSQGSIVAPGTDVNTGDPLARPAIYAVAATCLGLNTDVDVQALVDEQVARLVAFLTALLEEDLVAFLTCLGGGGDLEECLAEIEGGVEALTAEIEEILTVLLTALIDQDPDVAWAALYCLTGDNFETCEGPAPAPLEPAAPVQAVARFTG